MNYFRIFLVLSFLFSIPGLAADSILLIVAGPIVAIAWCIFLWRMEFSRVLK